MVRKQSSSDGASSPPAEDSGEIRVMKIIAGIFGRQAVVGMLRAAELSAPSGALKIAVGGDKVMADKTH